MSDEIKTPEFSAPPGREVRGVCTFCIKAKPLDHLRGLSHDERTIIARYIYSINGAEVEPGGLVCVDIPDCNSRITTRRRAAMIPG